MTRPSHFLLAAALASAACTPAPAADRAAPRQPSVEVTQGALRFQAVTRVQQSAPVQLATTVTVTNTSSQPQTVEMPGGCTVLLRAYRDASRTGTPAWDQQRDAICTMQLLIAQFAPGQSHTYPGSATAPDILGDSLPAGRYYLTAVLRPAGGTVEVPAGEADLSR